MADVGMTAFPMSDAVAIDAGAELHCHRQRRNATLRKLPDMKNLTEIFRYFENFMFR